MPESQNKEVVRRYWDEVMNQGNLEVIDEIVADDFIGHGPSPFAHNRGGLKETLLATRTLAEATGRQSLYVIEDIIAEDDEVATRVANTMRPPMDVEELYPRIADTMTNPNIWVENASRLSVAIHKLRAGKICEQWPVGYYEGITAEDYRRRQEHRRHQSNGKRHRH